MRGNSAKPILSPTALRLLFCFASINTFFSLKHLFFSFSTPDIFRKDFLQEYLLAKALLQHINPYLPLPDLAKLWVPEALNYYPIQHPIPHTPFVALLCVPLGYLSYETAAVVWLILQLAALLTTLALLLHWWEGRIKLSQLGLALLLVLGWFPLLEDLWCGQLNTFLLLLLTGAWLALRAENDQLGGGLLGGLIALKLTAWPIVIFLVLRRRWHAVLTAGLVALLANLSAVAVLGLPVVKYYYLKVGPAVAEYARSLSVNYSLWTIGTRLFVGVRDGVRTLPVWSSTSLASLLTLLIPILATLLGLWLARKAKNFDAAWGLLVVLSIMVSPTIWSHFLLLTVIPLVMLLRQLRATDFPRSLTVGFYLLVMIFSLPTRFYSNLVTLFAQQTTAEGVPLVPFSAGLLLLLPLAALGGLFWLLWRMECLQLPQHASGGLVKELSVVNKSFHKTVTIE